MTTPAKATTDLQNQHRREILLSLGKSLALPMLLLLFFLLAPRWWNAKVRDDIIREVQGIPNISFEDKVARTDAVRKMNFQVLCHTYPPYLEQLHQGLINSGVSTHFTRLGSGLLVAQILAGSFLLGLGTLFLLRHFSQKSPEALVVCYAWAWRIVMALALLNVLVGVPLLAFAVFEFTVLLAGFFIPKLLLMLLIGGGIAAWASIKILLTKIPLEFSESFCREISPQDSPALWKAVIDAAARLHTAPPDHILVGMQFNFYVTELAVHHGPGKTSGRTLYLSYPLLKQLPEAEVMAIVGHELGHFLGRDTVLTRRFFPLRQKIQAVVGGLVHAGWAGLPSIELLKCFWWSFEGVTAETSRQREFLADRAGAELTTPRTQGSALVRYHVVLEAFNRGLQEATISGTSNPFDVPASRIVGEKLAAVDAFWPALFHKRQAHPLDSHPTLDDRLAALSEPFTPEQARSLALEIPVTAFSSWFADREDLFSELLDKAREALVDQHRRITLTKADIEKPDDRTLLEQAFPPIIWHGKPRALWASIAVSGIPALGFLCGVMLVPVAAMKAVFAIIAVVLFIICARIWEHHNHAELTLSCSGLSYSGWSRPLYFSEIKQIVAQRHYTSVVLRIQLSPGVVSPWKGRFLPIRQPNTTLPLAFINEKPAVIAEAVFRYFTRQESKST